MRSLVAIVRSSVTDKIAIMHLMMEVTPVIINLIAPCLQAVPTSRRRSVTIRDHALFLNETSTVASITI
jgi:hypothetical protein